MTSLVTPLTTSILMTLIVCDLCLAWSIASDEYRHSNWWDLRNDKSNTALNSGIQSEDLFKKVRLYPGFKKRIEQAEGNYDDGVDRMIKKTLIKYSIECFLRDSHACLKADWLRAQQDRIEGLLLFIEVVDQNEESQESDINNYTEENIRDEVTREIRDKFHENKNNLRKRGPLISVDQSLHAVNTGPLRSSSADRQESSLSRLDILGR